LTLVVEVVYKVVEGVVEVVDNKNPTDKEKEILQLLQENPKTTTTEMADKLGVSQQAVSKRISSLKTKGRLRREGSDYDGKWVIIEKGTK
jgi:ATP-dependent DNA helicase RecG